jgi:predicted glutamine amidotransferase
MCRLYGLHANEPTRVECSLVRAQNALMEQSRKDQEGFANAHGWGLAAQSQGAPFVEKQAWAAYHGEHFKKAAARIYSKTVIAHVRRATVGPPAIENTHPFVHGFWFFAHNGTVPNFDQVHERLIDELDPLHRNEVHGSTDSEHVFRYLMTLWGHEPERPLLETLRVGLEQVIKWCREIDPNRRISLNALWTDGERMVGSRLNRTFWYLERDGLLLCETCGQSHVHHSPKQDYRAVEIASEPITHERWLPIPNGTVFSVDPDFRLNIVPLSAEAIGAAEGAESIAVRL